METGIDKGSVTVKLGGRPDPRVPNLEFDDRGESLFI